MNPSARFETAVHAPLTWHPENGGRRPLVCWEAEKTADLGPDPDGHRFQAIEDMMMSGNYYPPAVIQFFGPFRDESRDLRPGDRVLQRFVFAGIQLWSMVEIFVAERSAGICHIGYVTTSYHHGRGRWEARLTREDGRLSLTVKSISGPQSWLFWLALPIARQVQLRARESAIDRFSHLE